jgi:hypothetical protein
MNIETLKKEYIGKKLISIIDIDLKNKVVISVLKKITKDEYSDNIDNAKVLLFEDNKALVFVDFDSDGYRSGDWHLVHIKEMLDKNQTKGIKNINSIVRNIEYFNRITGIPETYDADTECILITTDEYVIRMGQRDTSDYYPSNFFDLQECKDVALGIKDYEEVERK